MDASRSSADSHPLIRFRKASQALYATQALGEVLTRIIDELCSALGAQAASVALVDQESDENILYATGPVAEAISGLRIPPGKGIIGWVIAQGRSLLANDVVADDRFWPDVDGYSGFQTRAVLCAPLFSGEQVIGALEVLNKRQGVFTSEDLSFLEAFGAVAAPAIENARHFHQEQQRRREADALRLAWEALTTPRDLEALFDVILDQLAQLIQYRSASILLVTEEGGLELGASRDIGDMQVATHVVGKLGLDAKIHAMVETRQPLLIQDTHTDVRWQHFAPFSYIRSWIGAPLLIKGHLIGTLNVDHDQPGYYTEDHARLVTSFAHQAAIAIENSRLYEATREATLKLAEQAQRIVTVHETSRALLSGLELDQAALHKLMNRIVRLTQARYGVLDILAENSQPHLFIAVGLTESEVADLNLGSLEHSILAVLSSKREVIRSTEFTGVAETWRSLPSDILNSFLGIAVHARGRTLGRLLLAGKRGKAPFSPEDETLALTLATNLASAIENASLYHKTQQRLRELTALYEITRTVTRLSDIDDIYNHLTMQMARLLDAEKCALLIYQAGVLRWRPPGYGMPPGFASKLALKVDPDDPLYEIVHAPEPLISNDVPHDPDLLAHQALLAQLPIRRLLSCRIALDEQQFGLLVVADKRNGEAFSEQDRHLVSILAHQVSSVLQRAALQNRQREHVQIQSALLKVSQAISSLTNLDELLKTVARITHRLVGCDHCLIASWEERHAAFVPRAQSGLDPALGDTFSQMHFNPEDMSCVERATEERTPVSLNRQDIREKLPGSMQPLLGLEHSLIVPLVVQERVVGLIIAAYTRERHPPGDREIALVTGIARQAAIAIENANLYQDLQHHAARLEQAYSELQDLDARKTQLINELEMLDERKTQFIQNVSHELRTPLTLIRGYLELLLEEEIGPLNAKQREGLTVVMEKAESLAQLVNDIATIQSIDTDALDLQTFDLNVLVEAVLQNLRMHARGADLVCELPSDLPQVKADPGLVARALRHLLGNALKFSPDGGQITVRAKPGDQIMYVEVEDQGIGIPAEAQPHVFDLFYQADGSTTRRFGGAGLGLSIVKQIIKAHDGQIGLSSVEGKGCTFYFTLPLAPL
jgi:GAF domain-containing protein